MFVSLYKSFIKIIHPVSKFITISINHRVIVGLFIIVILTSSITRTFACNTNNIFVHKTQVSIDKSDTEVITRTSRNLYNTGEYQKAIDTLNYFITNHEIDTLSTDFTRLLAILGDSYSEITLYQEAIKSYDLKIEILENLGESKERIAHADMNIINILHNIGDYERVIYHSKRAIDAHIETGSMNSLAITYSLLGDFFSKSMQYKIGAFFGELALACLNSSEDYKIRDRLTIESLLGSLYMADDNRKGVEHYYNSYNLLTQIPDNDQEIGWGAARLGWASLTASNYDDAVKYLTIGLEKLKPIYGEESAPAGHIYLALGEVYIYLNEFEIARDYLDKTYEIYYDISPDYNWLNVVYRMYGLLNEELGYTEKALLNFHRAIYYTVPGIPVNDNIFDFPDLNVCKNHDVTRYILIKKTSLFRRLYNETGNIKYLTASNDFGSLNISYVLDHCYKDFLSEYQMNKKMINDVNSSLRYRMLNLRDLKGQKSYDRYLREIFNDLSYAKAYVLQSRVIQAQGYNDSEANIIFDEIHSIQRKIDNLENTIRIMNLDDDELFKTKYDLALLYIDLFIKKQDIKEYETSTDSVSTSQMVADYLTETIDPNSVVLDYYLTDSTLNIFSITNGNISFYSSDIDSLFFDLLRNHNRALKTGSPIFYEYNQQLSTYLIDIISEEIEDKNKIIFIPHRELFHIPFEALVLPGDKGIIIDDYKVTYNYSANLLDTSPPGAIDGFTAFAPGFVDESNSLLSENIAVRSDTSYLNSNIQYRNGDFLVPIPYTIDEVKYISSILENRFPEQDIFIEATASKDNFIRSISNEGIIHVATHGHTSATLPGLSGLFFASDGSDHGSYMYMHELYGLKSRADLVVLSACKTGTGVLLDTEGAFALPRGFLSAGVRNVIASLWKVHDEKTKELMILFYEYLVNGYSYAEALRLAKLDCIDKGFLPMDWSGFVLIGN